MKTETSLVPRPGYVLKYIICVAAVLQLNVLPELCQADVSDDLNQANKSPADTLRLFNLNVAHGRGDAFNQIFLGKSTISQNLSGIASVLEKFNPDLVALQEVDRPSTWSGNLDQVKWIATRADLREHIHSIHASSILFDYGTALLSKHPIEEAIHHKFKPSPPTLDKGFTLALVRWQNDLGSGSPIKSVDVDVVSVHLDFSRQSVRTSQLEEMVRVLSERNSPLIIMGDLNSEWFDGGNIVQKLSEQLELNVFRPGAADLGTFASNGRRLDWILISREFEFIEYYVLPDVLSDHYALVATIKLKQTQD